MLFRSTPIPGPVASPQPTMTAALPAKGKVVTKSGVVYRVSTSTASVKTVTVLKLANNKKSAITIAKTITIDGYKYKVTGIEKKAFLGAKKLKSITIKTTTLKNVGKNALKNIYSKATIKVPASKLTAYKKLLKNKGQKSSVRIIK